MGHRDRPAMHTFTAPDPAVSARMARIRSAGTGPELAVRRALHALGVRWHGRTGRAITGRPDLAWRGAKVAVFIDGCFWHRCPDHYRPPKTNADWWDAKTTRNAARDAQVTAALQAAGWAVVRAWEHEPAGHAAGRIAATLATRRKGTRP